MQLQWNKTVSPYMQMLVRQVQAQEQTQELRLPEELPDIGRILCAWGQPVVRSKEWRGDGMSVSGGVSASVLYLPEDGSSPKCVEAWLPFQTKWNFPQAQREGTMRIKCLLRSLDARTLSARKMMVRASVGVLGEALEPSEAEIYYPGELPEGVEILTNVYPAVLPREAGEKQFFFEEELHIPGVNKWLSFQLSPALTEQNVVGSRLVMRGSGMLHYVYMDSQGQLHSGNQEIPFAQFADLQQDYDKEATADVILAVTTLEPEATDDGVRLQCGVSAQYLVWNRSLLVLAEDAYSPNRELQVQQSPLKLPMELDDRQENLEVPLPLVQGKVLDMTVLPDHPMLYRDGDTVNLEQPGAVQYLLEDEEGNLQSSVESWSAELNLPAAEHCQLLASLHSGDFSGSNARLKLNVQTCANQEMSMISGLTLGEVRQPDPNRPSLILCRMEDGSLWELAKSTGSTMAAIRNANQLTQEPQPGQLLLIPVS